MVSTILSSVTWRAGCQINRLPALSHFLPSLFHPFLPVSIRHTRTSHSCKQPKNSMCICAALRLSLTIEINDLCFTPALSLLSLADWMIHPLVIPGLSGMQRRKRMWDCVEERGRCTDPPPQTRKKVETESEFNLFHHHQQKKDGTANVKLWSTLSSWSQTFIVKLYYI